MIRFYIMPYADFGDRRRGPKYLRGRYNPSGIPVLRWAAKYYGLVDACLVAVDLTQVQHEQLAAEPDVAAAPEDIDQNISAIAIPRVQQVMEALRIPAGWVDGSYTYRAILRMIGGLFLFAQRYHVMHDEPLIDSAAQLDLRWNQILEARQNRIIATADVLGYDHSAVGPTWLVRRILKYLGDQWGATPIRFGTAIL